MSDDQQKAAELATLAATKNYVVLGSAVGFAYGAAWRMAAHEKLSVDEINAQFEALRDQGLASMLHPDVQERVVKAVLLILSEQVATSAAELDKLEG